MNEKEIYWIEYYKSTTPLGYNQVNGGYHSVCDVKLSNADIKKICEILLTTTIPQKKIAEMFHVGDDTISEINHGKTRLQKDMTYPLRQNHKYPKKYCIDCGKVISKTSIRCTECYYQSKVKSLDQLPVSREELKELIRTTSFIQIENIYGVTDNSVKKWCDKLDLPRKRSIISKIDDEAWSKL